ncbi:MAG: hypothetical protein N2510_01365 [Ignavibacteria bacterium]|nr:hypothetical protein [Ignavibacteria bacterium]
MTYRLIIFSICILISFISCNKKADEKNLSTTGTDTGKSLTKDSERKLYSEGTKNQPEYLIKFIPDGYSVLDTAEGDLNLDNISDIILVLKQNGEDTLSDSEDKPIKRPLLILIRNLNGELKPERRNDNTVLCYVCGGMIGDPYSGITIKDGFFSVEHFGGSATRWTRIITYKYSSEDNEWYLHKDGTESFNASDPTKVKSYMKTTKDFGKIKFEEFNIYEEQD